MSVALAGVCLALVTATGANAGPSVFVPVSKFTLAWTHSIEKVRWEEDYAVWPSKTAGAPPVLVAVAARVRGSGAGMEPPPDAQLTHGWYEYKPTQRYPAELRLTRSGFTADYDWCTSGTCRTMGELLATNGGVTVLTPCLSTPK